MYEAHGDFTLTRSGNILLFHASGAWNRETAMAFGARAKALIAPIAGRPWAIFSHITAWELSTPECNPILKTIVENGINQGLTCEAVVNTQGQVKLEQFNQSMPERGGLLRKVFEYESDAMQWLNRQGFHT